MFVQEEKYGPRLALSLCYCTSQDEAHPAEALRYQTKTSSGWQSGKHCRFPQELGFRFDGQVVLEKVRLLAHQSKIASCIDVYVADVSDEELQSGLCGAYEQANFSRLGHVRFSTNKSNGYMARELKTVGVNRRCAYLKLVLRRSHHNDYNLFQQVGIVAVAAHGNVIRHFNGYDDACESIPVGETVEVPLDEMLPQSAEEVNTRVSASTDGGIEDATRRRTEELRVLKARAVAEEDYDLADALKKQIDAIESSGKEIALLEQEKKKAVEAEDYRRAKELKQRIDEIRSKAAYRPPPQPKVTMRPTDNGRVESDTNGSSSAAAPPTQASSTNLPKPSAPPPHQPSARVVRGTGPNTHDEMAVGGKGYYDVDDPTGGIDSSLPKRSNHDVLSAQGKGEPWEKELNKAIVQHCPDQSVPQRLTGDALSEGESYERNFGVYCVACLFARRGQLREAGVRGVSSEDGFRALSSHTPSVVDTLLSYLSSKGRGVSDPVAGVVFASCEAVLKVLRDELPGCTPLSQFFGQLSKLTSQLVVRIGDTNNRIRENIEEVIMALARSPFGPDKITALLLVDPDKQAKKPANFRVHVSRLDILSTFVDEFGLDRASNASALDAHAILSKVVLPSMHHSSGDVRDAACSLFAKLAALDRVTCGPYLEGIKPAQQALVEQYMQAARDGQHTPISGPDMEADTVSVQSNNRSTPPPSRRGQQQRSSNHHEQRHPKQPPSPLQQQQQQQQQRSGRSSPSPDGYSDAKPSRQESGNRPNSGFTSMTSGGEQELRTRHTCQFCGEFDPNMTDENIDMHYVRYCPMLCPCPLCDQVTEICTLQQHLVSECEGRHLVRECPRCQEAVRVEDFKDHVAAKSCIEALPAFSICPLCHARFKSGLDGWRMHLASTPGCQFNPRKYDGSGTEE